MANVVILVLVLGALLFIAWRKMPHGVAWADGLTRVKPGQRGHAEWMAPKAVLDQVQHDYLSAWEWARPDSPHSADRNRWRTQMDQFFSGPYLSLQQARLDALSTARRVRMISTIIAQHQVVVRAFSSDGLTCVLVDNQTGRRATILACGKGPFVREQQLDDRAMIFRMAFDRGDLHWKIDELIQELPIGWGDQPPAQGRLWLSDDWPAGPGKGRHLAN